MAYELAIIVPTLNETGNVRPLVDRIARALDGVAWEIVFVDDDSTDGTLDVLAALVEERDNVRYLRRIGRRGLSSACIEGILATHAPLVAVMDADLQHDEALLPKMMTALRNATVEIVVGSRFADGGSADGLSSPRRERLSRWGNKLSRLITKTDLSDPMSGFFMMRRSLFDEVAHRLTGRGYKILLDILASARRPVGLVELPFYFRARESGESKLDTLVSLEFLFLLFDKILGGLVPARFLLFTTVGLIGMAIHLAVLALLFRGAGMSFLSAQGIAVLVAMTSNYAVNNLFTYRDRRRTGLAFYSGLLSFYLACGLGALVNLMVAEFLYSAGSWWLFAGFMGAVSGAVWNYAITATFTWRHPAK